MPEEKLKEGDLVMCPFCYVMVKIYKSLTGWGCPKCCQKIKEDEK